MLPRRRHVLSLALWVTLLVSLSAAGPAQAGTDWLPRFERAAIAYWGPLPCNKIDYQWVDPAVLPADADAGRCLIRFNTHKWNHMPDPGMRCVLVFHEIGHLYNHDHDEGGIMAANPPVVGWLQFKPCRNLVAPPKAKRTGVAP